jgi:DNA-binding response OmpR family regulator
MTSLFTGDYKDMETTKGFALLVEDDIDLANIFTGALQSANYETETVLDGTQARQILETKTPRIVILDLHLPGMSGIEILKYIRAEKRLADSRVVVITGDRNAAEEVREIADFVLVKPISFAQLRDLTARLQA